MKYKTASGRFRYTPAGAGTDNGAVMAGYTTTYKLRLSNGVAVFVQLKPRTNKREPFKGMNSDAQEWAIFTPTK